MTKKAAGQAAERTAGKEVAKKTGINMPVKMNITNASLEVLRHKYAKVPDVSKKEGYEVARLGIAEIRTLRTGLGDCKKEKKAEAIAFNKRVDTEYNRVLDILVAIETPLKTAKDAEDAKKEAAREEKRKAEETRKFKINQKINEIREIAFSFTDETSEAIREQIDAVKEIQITKDIYEEFTVAADLAKIDVKTRLEALLENVLAREKADAERKLEDERLADERKKLDDEKAAADKETERLKAIDDNLDHIKNLPFEYTGSSPSGIDLGIASLESMVITEDEFGEFTEEAKASKESVLDKLSIIKNQAEEMEDLQKKKEELDEREKKADEELKAAAEELRLKEEKEAQAKKNKKAEKANEKLQLEKYNESLASIELLVGDKKTAKCVLDAIMDGSIPSVTFG